MDALERLETLISEAQMAFEQPVQIFKHVCFQFQGVNYICKGKHILQNPQNEISRWCILYGESGCSKEEFSSHIAAYMHVNVCTHTLFFCRKLSCLEAAYLSKLPAETSMGLLAFSSHFTAQSFQIGRNISIPRRIAH